MPQKLPGEEEVATATAARSAARLALLVASLCLGGAVAAAQESTPRIERGEYIFRAAGCATCHTENAKAAPRLAGGRRFDTPFGVFYSPNITPHQQYGIGAWRAEDLIRALRDGEGPGSVHYYPVFPYTSYAGMRDDDIVAMLAYLQSVPAVIRENRIHELPWYMRYRIVNYFWKLVFHRPEPFSERGDKSAQWNRGAYLVNAVGHCGECHTPRNLFGATIRESHLAGVAEGPDGEPVPNITPDAEEGIGGWSAYDIARYLKTGLDPDGDVAGSAMADVIDQSLSHLTAEDIQAIVIYLRGIPARRRPRD